MKITDECRENLAIDTRLTGPEDNPPGQQPVRAQPSLRFLSICLVLVAAFFYFGAAYKIAVSKEPFIDEGWFASPAYNLAFHGFMGTTVMEPRGTWLAKELKGIHEYTYTIMPLYLLAEAFWYRLFGFGLVQMRLMSTFWGAIALAALYFIVERLTQNLLAAGLTVLFTAFDVTFLWSAADGRMDMMCVGLGLAGLAAFLLLREKNFSQSLLAANFLIAASIFTHPNGVFWALCLAVLAFSQDREKLRMTHLWTFAPYLFFAAGWGMYIAKRPDYFVAQFSANSNPPTGTRVAGILHPDIAAQREYGRYWGNFADSTWAWPAWPTAIWIPVLYWIVSAAAYLHFRATREKGLGTVLQLLVLCVFAMMFGDGLKAENYLAMVMPLYAAVAAVWLSSPRQPRRTLFLGYGLLGAILFLQTATLHEKLRVNPMRDEYRPIVAYLKKFPSAHVDGDAVLGFEFGYDRLTDDARVGLYSGRKPELLVVDRWYRWDWNSIFWHYDINSYYFTRRLVERDYHPLLKRGNYTVYQLNSWTPPSAPKAVN